MAGTESSRYVGPIVAKSGCERTIEWSSKALKDTAGRIIGVLSIGHDITELRAAQQRALQSERLAAIGEMVAGLAHESRNALHRGQVCLEMLALEVEDRPEALRLIARLQQAQDDLHTLYEDLRGYAAPIHLERRVCDLSEIWRAAWEHLAPLREGREAMLREEIEGLDLHCAVDPFRLEQVFRNILENSLAACRDPVEIAIHCTPWEVDGPSRPPRRRARSRPGARPGAEAAALRALLHHQDERDRFGHGHHQADRGGPRGPDRGRRGWRPGGGNHPDPAARDPMSQYR